MSPTQMSTVRKEFVSLWPHSRLTDAEWSVVVEKSARFPIDTDQASAALRNLKATADGPPSVAGILGALRNATPQTVNITTGELAAMTDRRSPGFALAEQTDELGMTSFERRVRDDPAFRVFARKAGRLIAERLDEIRRKAGVLA